MTCCLAKNLLLISMLARPDYHELLAWIEGKVLDDELIERLESHFIQFGEWTGDPESDPTQLALWPPPQSNNVSLCVTFHFLHSWCILVFCVVSYRVDCGVGQSQFYCRAHENEFVRKVADAAGTQADPNFAVLALVLQYVDNDDAEFLRNLTVAKHVQIRF